MKTFTNLLGYDTIAQTAALAAAAGEHMLLVGPPGQAKSLFARQFFSQFDGSLYETQLSRWADDSALFGLPDLARLRETGEVVYPARGIAAADWAFIDEIFDASDVLLRTLLAILQERKLLRGKEIIDIHLQSCIATANYTRITEMTEAVVDRFALIAHCTTLSIEQRAILYDGVPFERRAAPEERISIDELLAIRERAANIKIPASIVSALVIWAGELHFSPRRERKLAGLLKTSAARADRTEVDEADIEAVAQAVVPLSATDRVASAVQVRDRIHVALNEATQLAELAAAYTEIPDPLSNISEIKRCAKRVKTLRAYDHCSDLVASKKNQYISALATRHQTALEALGVLV